VRRCVFFAAVLSLACCSPSWTGDWLGKWTLASGRSDETCDGLPTQSQPLPSASLLLTINARDNQSLALTWAAMVNGSPAGECEQTADLSEPTTAILLSQSCKFSGRSYYVTQGALALTQSKSIEMQWVAAVPSGRATCRHDWQALFVAAGGL